MKKYTCKKTGKSFHTKDAYVQHLKKIDPLYYTKKYSMLGGITLLIVLVFIGAAYALHAFQNMPGPYDEFAQCISDSGAKFYGLYTCVHCNTQKEMFGRSQRHLPYVECSTAQQACNDAGVTSVPHWEFADGSVLTGRLEFDVLAQQTGCTFP
ncbi:MAG: hypothetical protein ACMXYC_00820 [Candidatus Woesearchaeota archaeon]